VCSLEVSSRFIYPFVLMVVYTVEPLRTFLRDKVLNTVFLFLN